MPKVADILSRAGSTVAGTVAGTVANGAKRARAFTLLEILVAVAALGLIAVGVASIFDATGKTISAGRRLSAFNSYASLIEQQLRADIASMTRDGFLVIRNEYADAVGDGLIVVPLPGQTSNYAVPLFDGDERPRLRRIDELMFFAKGDFVTARQALHPAYIARSDAARIYYGHGQRARVPGTFNANDCYYLPELDGKIWQGNSNPEDQNARLGFDFPENPNRFASDWILLRHVTLLAPPRTAQILPSTLPFGIASNSGRLDDSPVQISLQPAASNVFRALCGLFPNTTDFDPIRSETQAQHPWFTSGLVDIAATDLAVIRSIVTTANVVPLGANAQFFNPLNNSSANEQLNAGVDGIYRLWGLAAPLDPGVIDRAQQWMDDAFPANSMAAPANRTRMRCELTPRNFVGALDSNNWGTDEEAAYRAADQVMLSASNFLPRCTEFIVEWSFGKTWPSDPNSTNPAYSAMKAGQFVWHGMDRRVGIEPVAQYYNQNDLLAKLQVPWVKNDGTITIQPETVQNRLIHGESTTNAAPVAGQPLTSYFGYFDPTFNPDADNDGNIDDPDDSASPTIPWAWPKLIRVTLSLADPSDPSIERTYQFVFQVPEGN